VFAKQQKVYFGHIDGAGIVYHPHFVDYFNQAYEDLLEELGLGGPSLQDQLGVRVPVVNLDLDFRKPMRSGQRLTIEVRVERIGTTSLVFRFDALDEAGDVVVEGTVTRVTVDDAFTKVPVPDRLRDRLEEHIVEG
jgi:acyl-CoA thioester hydrolase